MGEVAVNLTGALKPYSCLAFKSRYARPSVHCALLLGQQIGRGAVLLAVPSLRVVPDAGNRSAPCMMAALARFVHNCQRAADAEHNCHQGNQQGGLHRDLLNAPPELPPSELLGFK